MRVKNRYSLHPVKNVVPKVEQKYLLANITVKGSTRFLRLFK